MYSPGGHSVAAAAAHHDRGVLLGGPGHLRGRAGPGVGRRGGGCARVGRGADRGAGQRPPGPAEGGGPARGLRGGGGRDLRAGRLRLGRQARLRARALPARGRALWAAEHPLDLQVHQVRRGGEDHRPQAEPLVRHLPVEEKEAFAAKVEALFDIPCQTLPNFLNLTLTPSNQILHPAQHYYGIFRDWDGRRTYTRDELAARNGLTLYDDFDDFSAECLAAIDNELQQIRHALCRACPQLDLSSCPDRRAHPPAVRQGRGRRLQPQGHLQLEHRLPGLLHPAAGGRPGGVPARPAEPPLLGGHPLRAGDPEEPGGDAGQLPHAHAGPLHSVAPAVHGQGVPGADGQLNRCSSWRPARPYKYGIHTLEDLVSTCLPQTMAAYRPPRARL
ncbi:unnamed protein product [Heterosigma akashiwo]